MVNYAMSAIVNDTPLASPVQWHDALQATEPTGNGSRRTHMDTYTTHVHIEGFPRSPGNPMRV